MRGIVAVTVAVFVAPPAAAQTLPNPASGLLARASDSALDKLARPGAFLADEAIRIALPGPLKDARGLFKLADRVGLTNDLTKTINDAAGVAAGEAKPIFRSAINRIGWRDAVGIVGKGDGGSRYLQQSAGADLKEKVRPLVLGALTRAGAFGQLKRLGGATSLLGGAGITEDTLTDSVTDQAMQGIFTYIGREETRVRADPLGTGGKLLKGVLEKRR